ncbi:hypothetical protein ACKRZS_006886 [Fusarium odoratissimum]
MRDVMTSLEPQMGYICNVSGATGLPLSVVSGGKEAYVKHFGFRDVCDQGHGCRPRGNIGRGDKACIQGFNTAVYLIPEAETAIIAMQNSSGLGDACDWIPQMVIHKLSGSTKTIEFPQLATVAAKAAPGFSEKIQDELQKRREIQAATGMLFTISASTSPSLMAAST